MRITSLRPDPRAPDCLIVEADGARFASIPVERARELRLEADKELTEREIERLEYVADVEASYRVAVRMLGARPRAVQEVLRRLRQRGHNPSAAAEAVGRLEAEGLLDDAEFARHFARVRSAKGHGPSRLLTDLLRKGVERRQAEHAIDEVLEAEGFDASAEIRALAEKRRRQLGDLPRRTLFRRIVGYLNRRGYRGREVMEVVEEVIGE